MPNGGGGAREAVPGTRVKETIAGSAKADGCADAGGTTADDMIDGSWKTAGGDAIIGGDDVTTAATTDAAGMPVGPFTFGGGGPVERMAGS